MYVNNCIIDFNFNAELVYWAPATFDCVDFIASLSSGTSKLADIMIIKLFQHRLAQSFYMNLCR